MRSGRARRSLANSRCVPIRNDKLDLLQAEAVADLIASGSLQAARAAQRSLDGQFSAAVQRLQAGLTRLRVRVEAWLDFPEEELPFDAAPQCLAELDGLLTELDELGARARSGRALRDGLCIAIAGPPNAGKSSLLNRLAGYDAAIVTELPGTTRDALREHLLLDDLPVTIVDTAGLRETTDPIEREGVRRSRAEVTRADRVLWVVDVREPLAQSVQAARAAIGDEVPFTVLANKVDLIDEAPRLAVHDGVPVIRLSALTGAGTDALIAHLKEVAGLGPEVAGTFSARRRHVDALARVRGLLIGCADGAERRARADGRASAHGASGAQRADRRADERRSARRDLRDVLYREIASGGGGLADQS